MTVILGIESSCDDTGAAIVNSEREILANIVISQKEEHALFQGVVPEIAARAHLQNVEKSIILALQKANIKLSDIDAIAATSGPGLIGGVIVGCMYGKGLASTLKKPFIAVNHLEGHALTARLTNQLRYPFLLLLASGGHCQFVAVEGLGKYKTLGQTLDDAAGEAFDKVAKMLSLPFPGGPEIEKIAKIGNPIYKLPKPIINQPGCDMSFSGLKTATRLLIEELKPMDEQKIADIGASFQHVVGEILAVKAVQAIVMYEKICQNKMLVLAGGVAANQYLKNAIQNRISLIDYSLIAPPIELCTDNAAMIAYAGLERLEAGLTNTLDFCPRARWNLDELSYK
ncbi:MAG: tRNA (adenosine(37)-N6)-threonylcarbamoyltransferase complex transferase subunit TsaD [Rickettsiaceae bacterium]|nr:MAG: tRNA (adenosine(37)-N6)-threonylcarbamoyltransferase complex transferase subunit TsaD [Rickettsiaceae bacterium]